MKKLLAKLRAALKTKEAALAKLETDLAAKQGDLTDEEIAQATKLADEVSALVKQINDVRTKGAALADREADPADAALDDVTRDADDAEDDDGDDDDDADAAARTRGATAALQRRSARPGNDGRRARPAQAEIKLTTVQRMGLIAMSVAESEFRLREDRELVHPMKILDERGYGHFAKEVEVKQRRSREFLKTLNASTAVSGGILTPDTMNSEIIELLYPQTTFLQGGPRIVNMPNGTYRQPAGATGSQAGYRQEGGPLTVTEPTFQEVSMSTKFLGAIVPMTREMLDFSIPGTEAFIRNDLGEAMGQALDLNAYFGSGTQGEPLGIFNRPGIQLVAAVGGDTPTLAQIDQVTSSVELRLVQNHIRNMAGWAWTMSPRTFSYLSNMRVGDNSKGEYAFPAMNQGKPIFRSRPVLLSTNFPDNLGNDGDESILGLVNFPDVFFGQQGEVAFATSNDATININGTWVSAFQNNLVFLRAMHAHDVALRRKLSVVKVTGLTWGAGLTI